MATAVQGFAILWGSGRWTNRSPMRSSLACRKAGRCFIIRDELAVRRLFFHDFDTGAALKGLTPGFQPPRSLYTDLPRRFCFQKTARMPGFLDNLKTVRKALRNVPEPCWYQLTL
jgi:hypothetical protein